MPVISYNKGFVISSPASINGQITVLYEDNHLFVVNKPAGLLTQKDHTGAPDLLTICKQFLKEKYSKPGNVFLGLVHRLDRPVSGAVVLAKTSKAAARLSEQIKNREIEKKYIALVEGEVPTSGWWRDGISRKKSWAFIDHQGKDAQLLFERKDLRHGISMVEITLLTGRHHQIRIQFASRGFPIVGDMRYGGKQQFVSGSIALHSCHLAFLHPTRKKTLAFTCEPDDYCQNWECCNFSRGM